MKRQSRPVEIVCDLSITSEAFTVVFSTVSLTASVAFVVASLIVSFALEVVLFLIIISYSN